MIKNVIIGLAAFFIVALVAFVVALARFGGANPPLPVTEVKIGDHAFRVEIANTTTTRARGLSGRERLGESEGMLFVFDSVGSHGFWMKGMKFPIDIVWIAGNRVLGVTENVQPETGAPLMNFKVYYPPAPADKVLEIASGGARREGIVAGGAVSFFFEKE